MAVGGILVAHLIILFDSWRITFIVVGLFTMLLSLAAWRILRDRPAQHTKVDQAELDYITAGNIIDSAETDDATPTQGLGIKLVYHDRHHGGPGVMGHGLLGTANLGPQLFGAGLRV